MLPNQTLRVYLVICVHVLCLFVLGKRTRKENELVDASDATLLK